MKSASKLLKLIHSDEFVAEVADKCMEYQQKEQDNNALLALEDRKAALNKSIQNMLAAIEAGIITPSTKTRLNELEAEMLQVEKGIAKEKVKEPPITKEQVIFFLTELRNGDANDDIYTAFLIDTFLNAAYLYDDDKLVLVLNYTGKNSKVTLRLIDQAVKSDEKEFGFCAASCTIFST